MVYIRRIFNLSERFCNIIYIQPQKFSMSFADQAVADPYCQYPSNAVPESDKKASSIVRQSRVQKH